MAEIVAPRVQRRRVVAKPMPELAPVTVITFPANGVGESRGGKSISRPMMNFATSIPVAKQCSAHEVNQLSKGFPMRSYRSSQILECSF
jgi:hypothetical protein